jgi:hypothetical protein
MFHLGACMFEGTMKTGAVLLVIVTLVGCEYPSIFATDPPSSRVNPSPSASSAMAATATTRPTPPSGPPPRSPGELDGQVTNAARLANDALRIEGGGAADFSRELESAWVGWHDPSDEMSMCTGAAFRRRAAAVAQKSKVAALAGQALCLTNLVDSMIRDMNTIAYSPLQYSNIEAGADRALQLAFEAHKEAERNITDRHTKYQAEQARLDEASAACDPAKAHQMGRPVPPPDECQHKCSTEGDQAYCLLWAIQLLNGPSTTASAPSELEAPSSNPGPPAKFEKALPLLKNACSMGIDAACSLASQAVDDEREATKFALSLWWDVASASGTFFNRHKIANQARQLGMKPETLQQLNAAVAAAKVELCTAKKAFVNYSGTAEFSRLAADKCRYPGNGQELTESDSAWCRGVFATACQ